MKQDDPGDELPGVVEGTYFSPAVWGVRAMLKELTDFVLALAKLLVAAAILIRSIRRK